jgi:hypothetical protein
MLEGNEGIPSLGLPGATAFAGFQAALAAQRLLASQRLAATEAETPTIAAPGATEFVPTPPVTTGAPTEVREETQPTAPPPPVACPPPATPKSAPCITISQATVCFQTPELNPALRIYSQRSLAGWGGDNSSFGMPHLPPSVCITQDVECPVECKTSCFVTTVEYGFGIARRVQQIKEFDEYSKEVVKLLADAIDQNKGYPACAESEAKKDEVRQRLVTRGLTLVLKGHVAESSSNFYLGKSTPTKKEGCKFEAIACVWILIMQPNDVSLEYFRENAYKGITKEDLDSLKQFMVLHELGHVRIELVRADLMCAAMAGKKLTFGPEGDREFGELVKNSHELLEPIRKELQRTYDEGQPDPEKVTKDSSKGEETRSVELSREFIKRAKDKGSISNAEAERLNKEISEKAYLDRCGSIVIGVQ